MPLYGVLIASSVICAVALSTGFSAGHFARHVGMFSSAGTSKNLSGRQTMVSTLSLASLSHISLVNNFTGFEQVALTLSPATVLVISPVKLKSDFLVVILDIDSLVQVMLAVPRKSMHFYC